MNPSRIDPSRMPFGRGRRAAARAAGRAMVAAVALAAASGAPARAEEPFDLAPGDRVSITIFDQPDLSGSYLVQPNGEIDMPLLGGLGVATLTPKALQADLTARLANGFIQNPVVSVRLAELRPVTVVGAVRGAGRFTFIDGMTVETALALAGGGLRLGIEEAAQNLELVRARGRFDALALTELSQRVHVARLEAALKNAPRFDVPGDAGQMAGPLKRFADAEQRTLDADRAALASQAALLDQQLRTIQGDAASFADQVEAEKAQVAVLDGELADLGGLLSKGITRKSPVQDLQRERSKVQSNLARVLGELARSRSAQAEIKLRIDEVGTTYHNRLMTELQAGNLLLEQARAGLPAAREELRLLRDKLPYAIAGDGAPPEVRISRYTKGRIETTTADPTTPLRPGDIVQIGRGLDAAAPATRLPEPEARPAQAPAVSSAAPPATSAEEAPSGALLSRR